MAPKNRVTRGLCGKNTLVHATKAAEKKKTFRRLQNPALATLDRSLAPGDHKKKQVTWSVRAGLCFPIDRIRRYLKKGRYSQRIGFGAPFYLATILEYLTAELLEIVSQASKDTKKTRIIPRHVMLAVMRDEDLIKLLAGITIAHGSVLPNIHLSLLGESPVADAAKSLTVDAAKSP